MTAALIGLSLLNHYPHILIGLAVIAGVSAHIERGKLKQGDGKRLASLRSFIVSGSNSAACTAPIYTAGKYFE